MPLLLRYATLADIAAVTPRLLLPPPLPILLLLAKILLIAAMLRCAHCAAAYAQRHAILSAGVFQKLHYAAPLCAPCHAVDILLFSLFSLLRACCH